MLENLKNNEDNIEEKLRAESMMDEMAHQRYILGKEDPFEDINLEKLAIKRFRDIYNHYQEFKDYYDGHKNLDKYLVIIGGNEEIIKNLEKYIEKLQLLIAGKGSEEQFEIDKKIKDSKKVLNDLKSTTQDFVREIEKFINAEKPDGPKTNIGKNKKDNSWKN